MKAPSNTTARRFGTVAVLASVLDIIMMVGGTVWTLYSGTPESSLGLKAILDPILESTIWVPRVTMGGILIFAVALGKVGAEMQVGGEVAIRRARTWSRSALAFLCVAAALQVAVVWPRYEVAQMAVEQAGLEVGFGMDMAKGAPLRLMFLRAIWPIAFLWRFRG